MRGSTKIMPHQERLRETVAEKRVLREREEQRLSQARNIFECIEKFTTAKSPEAGLNALIATMKSLFHADAILALQINPHQISQPDDPALPSGQVRANVVVEDASVDIGTSRVVQKTLFSKPRNLTDTSALEQWDRDTGLGAYSSALIVPFTGANGSCYIVCCLRVKKHGFKKIHLPLLERLVGLVVQAIQGRAMSVQNGLLAAIIQGSSIGVSIVDVTVPEMPLIYVNAAFEALTGYSASEVLGRNCRFLTAEPFDSPERTRLRKTVASKGVGRFLLRNVRKNGEPFWNDITLFPVTDENGVTRNLVATQNDATIRIQAQAERDQTRQRMEQAMISTADAFLMLGERDEVLYANDATRVFFPSAGVNWRKSSMFRQNWAAYLEPFTGFGPPLTATLTKPDLHGLAEIPLGRELNLPDGRAMLIRARKISDGTLVVSATNVTPLKTANALLKQRLAAIETAFDGIAIADPEGRLLYLNPAAAQMLDLDKHQSGLGRKWAMRYSDPALPKDRDSYTVTLARTRTNGTEAVHEITLTPLETTGSVIIFRDITARVETERREIELRQALSQSKGREALSQLAAGVAHDFNNLLSAINGSATLISLEASATKDVREHADRISRAGNRAAKLVNRLLDLGGTNKTDTTFDLRAALVDLPALVVTSLPEGVQLTLDLGETEMLMAGDPGEMSQVAVNLILNARDAIAPAHGSITLRVTPYTTDVSETLQVGVLEAGRSFARLDIADTGTGLDPDVLEQIFEPYFTTKGDQGTGIGLAMVAMQTTALDGGVCVRSVKGEGTVVSVFWPFASKDTPVAHSDHQLLDVDSLKGQTILLVDDEIQVAEVLQSFLERLGAEVALCTDPRDAAEAIQEDPAAWSALITDYDMPHMSGGALVERARRYAPDLSIFVVTALARRLNDPRILSAGVKGVFAKPVDLGQLCMALAQSVATTTT
jgi:two-component system cell cycle sensor histidine kinase/response regulator CckA